MRRDNPAVYECPKNRSTIHHWVRREDGTAYCLKCRAELSPENAADCFHDTEQ